MSSVTGTTHFTVAAGATFSLTTAFNGTTTHGGDYVGPMVAVPVPNPLKVSLKVSTTTVKFLHENDDGLTSTCIYLYTVTNTNSFSVKFRVDKFFD